LIAAHAATQVGLEQGDVSIFSQNGPSPLFGCQYLHSSIPGIDCGNPVEVDYQLVGSAEMYWRKVYDEAKPLKVSPEELGGKHLAWDIRRAYAKLVDDWFGTGHVQRAIVDRPLVADPDYQQFIQSFDLVISTIPRHIWCVNQKHNFTATDIWAMGDAPELGRMTPFRVAQDNSVVCNGLHDVGWYRMSRVFDHNTIEWPIRRKPPIEGIARVQKPISTNCDCWDGQVEFLGRYGEWKKGVLAHQVYDAAKEVISRVAKRC
jgi:hypothetical protein